MSDKKKNTSKFSFNSFWIYIPIIIVLIALSFFNSGAVSSSEISKNEFTKILEQNDISKVLIINKSFAEIFISDEAAKKEQHKKIADNPFNFIEKALLYTAIILETYKILKKTFKKQNKNII